jgi:hypothetical protein
MTTLYINLNSTRCGNCNKGAMPDDITHTKVYGYGVPENALGCGTTFDAIDSDYTDMKARCMTTRPDLPWVGAEDIR